MPDAPGMRTGPRLLQDAEPAVDPTRPIVDAHHHLWGPPRDPYDVEDLLADAHGSHHVVATVYVDGREGYDEGPESLRPVGETRYANAVRLRARDLQAGQEPAPVDICSAIIGHADLAAGAPVREVLLRHLEAGGGRFRGVRHLTAHDPEGIALSSSNPPPGLMGSDLFRQGFAQLARLGMSYDAWVVFHQLGEVLELAEAFPETPIVVDHLGTPLGAGPYAARSAEVFATWRAGIEALARRQNVFVKIGGLGMGFVGLEVDHDPQRPASESLARTWRAFVDAAIDAFGPDRAMFESNFPVDRGACGYAVLWNAFQRLANHYSDLEQEALFSGTATRFYDLCVDRGPAAAHSASPHAPTPTATGQHQGDTI